VKLNEDIKLKGDSGKYFKNNRLCCRQYFKKKIQQVLLGVEVEKEGKGHA